MYKWYVLQVISGKENKIKKSLEEFIEAKSMVNLIEEIVIPSEKVSEVKKGEQKVSDKKIWPGYILIKMELTDDSWAYVKNTTGVIDFLGGKEPEALNEKEVTAILSDIAEKQKHVVQKHNIEIGDKVKIVDGVFVNFIGSVIEVFHDKGRLSVMVSIFGRDTRVDDLEFWQVEQVSNEQ